MDINERSELELLFQSQTGQPSREEVETYGGSITVIYADGYVEWLEEFVTNRLQ